MTPSVEAFDEAKYKALMDGLECSEVPFSEINLGDRIDSDYYTKNYLHISKLLANVTTKKLGSLAYTVASAFYPAATQLYSEGDTPFARCVDCVSYPIITKNQDSRLLIFLPSEQCFLKHTTEEETENTLTHIKIFAEFTIVGSWH